MHNRPPDVSTAGAAALEPRGHQAADVDAGPVGWFSVGLVVLVVATAAASFALLGGFRVPPPPSVQAPQADAPTSAPVPALQSFPAGDLRAYRQDKDALLQGYRWVDRGSGIVQLPIERAMQLIVERGEPRAAPPADAGRR